MGSYANLCERRNLQMLAMISMVILLAERKARDKPVSALELPSRTNIPERQYSSSGVTVDYFSLRPRSDPPREPSPQPTVTPPAPTPTADPSRSSPATSPLGLKAGSWSRLLYPTLLISGVSEGSSNGSYKGRGSDPPTPVSSADGVPGSIPVPGSGRSPKTNPRSPRSRKLRSELSMTVAYGPGSVGSGGTNHL